MKKILSAVIVMGLLMQSAACRAEIEETVILPATETAAPTVCAETETPAPAETPAPCATEEVTETELPTQAPTEIPTEETPTTQAPTEIPTEVPPATQAPTQAPELPSGLAAVSEYEEIPEDAEAWTLLGEGYVCGSLERLAAWAGEKAELRLRRADVMEIKDASLQRMASLKLTPDERVFADGRYRAAISMESPERVEEPAELDLTQWIAGETDETADLFVWVVKDEPQLTPEPTEETEEVKLEVRSEDCRPGEWSNVHPTFLLSGIPEGKNRVYAAVIYDERIAVLSGDSYTAEEEGVYTLRFVILDELGDIADASEKYTLCLDHTLPEVAVSMDEEKDYTLHVDMADGMSGLRALSTDGGASWIELGGGNSERYTISGKMTIAAGMLQVCDAAGNVWVSSESYETVKLSGGGSSGGGSGSSTTVKQHAAAEESDSRTEYDALAMQFPEEAMHVLTIDGQELELTLELANAEGFDLPEDYCPTFTAELAAWAADAGDAGETDKMEEEDAVQKDTLLLKAVEEEGLGDRLEYRWKFNGEVYRLLANSGIRYLALEIGGEMAVFPTEGFVGGTKYTELKMLGVSTRRFDYTVAMRFDLDPDRIPELSVCDFSEDCDLAVMAEVENVRYVLSDEQRGEMYYCNVYLGPEEMMEVPYGSYGA